MAEESEVSKGQATIVKPEETRRSHDNSTDVAATLIGLLFWVIVLGAWAYSAYWPDNATVMLDVSPSARPVATGKVLFDGAPVTAGEVKLTVEDAQGNRYLSSAVVPVSRGAFTTGDRILVPKDYMDKPLRITADFSGQKVGKSKDEIMGEAIVYLNFSPPIIKKHVGWAMAGAVGLMLLALMFLFTVPRLTRGPARMLFAITYLMVLMSLIIPLAGAFLVSQSEYMLAMMMKSPIGLVKGTANGIREQQWLVNIGGAVIDATASSPGNEGKLGAVATTGTAPSAPATATSATTVATQPAASPALTAATETKVQGVNDAETILAANAKAAVHKALPEKVDSATGANTLKVVGGLAIPFYVVMLAMLGAGINMARTVPKIQQDFDMEKLESTNVIRTSSPFANVARSVAQLPVEIVTSVGAGVPESAKEISSAFKVRKELIENYMYLLSAPFLAIAVYYLLQVVATEVAQPILVVMAFATGLISDRIVRAIIKFAKDKLPGEQPGQQAEQEQTEK